MISRRLHPIRVSRRLRGAPPPLNTRAAAGEAREDYLRLVETLRRDNGHHHSSSYIPPAD